LVQKISVIGGDLRLVYLTILLSKENYQIKVFGLDKEENALKKSEFSNNIKICNSLSEAIFENDLVITSIPFSKDDIYLNMPLSDSKITIKEFINKIENKKIIAGGIKENINELAKNKNAQIIDLMKLEDLAINNTIATAEGTIKIAIEETEKTIFNSNVLILGFGRVGKVVAERFDGLKANVYCEARKKEDLAWINTLGYYAIHLDKMCESLSKFDIIVNTIPAKILKENELKNIKKDCLIIDLASIPGGVDFEKAKEYEIKTIHALGVPGNVAPYTSAEFIKKAITEFT
jgi:dipicolinate synthase subunit A